MAGEPATSARSPRPRSNRPAAEVLSRHALNRALLERQFLLRRERRSALEVVEHLVGLQAQEPQVPYVTLWSRLEAFQGDELSELLASRRVVRMPLQRATIHLVSDRDCLELRPTLHPVLERCFRSQSPFGKRLQAQGMDLDALRAAGRALLEERPRTRAELRRLLHQRWPDADAEAMAQAIAYLEPVVQVPPRGLWRERGQATWAPVTTWLGRPFPSGSAPDDIVLRYLAAFGPATPGDARIWSGLTGLREVFARLRPRLRTFRDEQGRELFDLPDAPLPDAETPAPVRFLGEYDNIALSHADRGRIMGGGQFPQQLARKDGLVGAVLVDGFFDAAWQMSRERDVARLRILPLRPLTTDEEIAVAEEGARLLAFVAAEAATRDVAVAPPV